MLVQTSTYSIEIEGAKADVYDGKMPTRKIAINIISGFEFKYYSQVYDVVLMLHAVGAPIPESMNNIDHAYAGHMGDCIEYRYFIWLIAPDVCPIERLLTDTYARMPYAWAALAYDFIKINCMGFAAIIDLLNNVRFIRIASPFDDYLIEKRNKEARAAFLVKFAAIDAFDPQVMNAARQVRAFNGGDTIVAPKFSSLNSRKINLGNYPTKNEFFERFHEATFNIFKDFEHWDRIGVAGGMISKLLTNDKSTDTSDIDVFVIGKTTQERIDNFNAISIVIESRLKWLYPQQNIYVIPRGSVMSIYVANTAIKIQIISSRAKNVCETISRFDFSPSCAGVSGDNVYITPDFLESYTTGVATPVNTKRITAIRIIKLLWRGWVVAITPEIAAQIDTNKLVHELETKNDKQLVAELDACMMLTPNDSFNILLLAKLNENSTITMDVASGVNMIEFNADFGAYMHATFSWHKFFKAMEQRVNAPARGQNDVTVSVANSGRALVLSVEQLVVVEAPQVMPREQYAFRFMCSAEPEFVQFCKRLESEAYKWWGSAAVAIHCVTEANNIAFYIPRDYHRRKYFTNEFGDDINPKQIAVGTKISPLAFRIMMRYRHYPGVYLECTAGIISQGMRRAREEIAPADESAIIYE